MRGMFDRLKHYCNLRLTRGGNGARSVLTGIPSDRNFSRMSFILNDDAVEDNRVNGY